jgi:hypothetical protein
MSETYIPKALRQRVASQARYRCGYCLTLEATVGTPMEVDHIIPQALGGPTGADPLLKVAGCLSGPPLSAAEIEAEIYGEEPA